MLKLRKGNCFWTVYYKVFRQDDYWRLSINLTGARSKKTLIINTYIYIYIYIIRTPNNTNIIQHLFTIVSKNGRCNNCRLYSTTIKRSKDHKVPICYFSTNTYVLTPFLYFMHIIIFQVIVCFVSGKEVADF